MIWLLAIVLFALLFFAYYNKVSVVEGMDCPSPTIQPYDNTPYFYPGRYQKSKWPEYVIGPLDPDGYYGWH
jgi:hypothetical protein